MAMTEDMLPIALRQHAIDLADRMQVPLDFPAVALVCCLAGATNRRALIQPKANDHSWREVPNLWGGIVALPGSMKSPLIAACAHTLRDIESEHHQQHLREMADYRQKCEVWEEECKAARKDGKNEPPKPVKPNPRRLVMNDATFEAFHVAMSHNPSGLFLIRDELTGLLSEMERAGREGQREFLLMCWNGNTSHTLDRIGRGTVHVPHCCISMLGGIQPARVEKYWSEMRKDGSGNDGLFQRFQLLIWPDLPDDWQYVDRAPNVAAEQRVTAIFRKLVGLDSENPLFGQFDQESQRLFVQFLSDLESTLREGDQTSPILSHLSKYRGLMPSLALLFELADRASSDGFDGAEDGSSRAIQVSLEHAQQALHWCSYLASHASRIYSSVSSSVDEAIELAEKIRTGAVGAGAPFTCRDVYMNDWKRLNTPALAQRAIEKLETKGWVRRVRSDVKSKGRPTMLYEVNPKLYLQSGNGHAPSKPTKY